MKNLTDPKTPVGTNDYIGPSCLPCGGTVYGGPIECPGDCLGGCYQICSGCIGNCDDTCEDECFNFCGGFIFLT